MSRLARLCFMCTALWLVGLIAVPKAEASQSVPPCTELPPIAWDPAPATTVQFVLDFTLPRSVSAKDLYLQAMCGAQNATIWGLIDSGEGAAVAIPPPLATALDQAVPHLPRVDFMYVRGGGRDREAIVILFANGYDGPFFKFDLQGEDNPWRLHEAELAAAHWNTLPYEVMRRASHWLHDAAKFHSNYTVHLQLLGGLIDIQVFEMTGGRALALFLGSMFISDLSLQTPQTDANFLLWGHEIAHYVDYEIHGVQDFFYARNFAAISRENNRILGIPIPFWFRERYAAAQQEIDAFGGCENVPFDHRPFGYVSKYALCGEMLAEDWGETLSVALGTTHAVHAGPLETDTVDFTVWDENSGNAYDIARLYGRAHDSDASILGAKLDYVRNKLTIHKTAPQDADGDGVWWSPSTFEDDCDDINPVLGLCLFSACTSNADCDDGDACTVGTCQGSTCHFSIVDTDGDGSPDGACGGTDCDDLDPLIHAGSTRSCVGACQIPGTQICIEASWSECSAPQACDCVPGSQWVSQCASCSHQVFTCLDDGSWDDGGPCVPNDPTNVDPCHPGTVQVLPCGIQQCGGHDIPKATTQTCNASCEWQTTQACTLTEPTALEVCNGIDDDCNGAIDQGCPSGLTFVQGAPSPMYGHGGTFNESNCPAGHVLVGFGLVDSLWGWGAWWYNVLGGLTPICAPMELVTSGNPHAYSIAHGPNVLLPAHGDYNFYHDTVLCASGEAIIGVDLGVGGALVDRLKIRCGKFHVQGSIGSYALTRTHGGQHGPLFHGSSTNTTYDCPGQGVMTGVRTRTTDALAAIGFNCSQPSLQIQ